MRVLAFVIIFVSFLQAEIIQKYSTDVDVHQNGSLDITETIYYHFDTPRHGIYRDIPLTIRTMQSKFAIGLGIGDFWVQMDGGQVPWSLQTIYSPYSGKIARLKIGEILIPM